MAPTHVKHWIEGGRHVLRLVGAFDAEAARELLQELQRVAEGDIVVDVGLVRGCDEAGVVALARLAESSQGYRIALRGLSAHQLRILRYLGARLSNVGAEAGA